MYGGKVKDDEKAMKSANHELKGLNSFFQCGLDRLNYALMALIYFRGFCMIAQSLLPINTNTIVYGSNNAGTIFS